MENLNIGNVMEAALTEGTLISSKSAIEKILAAAQSGSRARTVSYDDVKEYAKIAKDLITGKTEDKFVGLSTRTAFRAVDDKTKVIFKINPHAQNFAGSYNGAPKATFFEIGFTENGVPMFLGSYRGNCNAADINFSRLSE